MWIVRLALRRPYTFVVMALLIGILGGLSIATMPVDIFPYIDLPVVSVVWQYNGLTPEEMESRIVTNFERALTANVVGIEHVESQSHQSVAVVRVFFHPTVEVDLALSQIVTQCQVQVRNMPPGTFPPQVLKYDAASVPILQLGLSSQTLTEQEIFDLGNNFIRTPLATVQGATVSYPFGGKNRQIMVDLNLDELYAKRLSPIDVSNSLNLQNLIVPAGTAKFAGTEYPDPPEQQPAQHRGVQQPADQDGERRDHLPQGRRHRPRRLRAADQHRPHQRGARRPADRDAQRQGVHAGGRQRGEGHAAQGHVHGHAGPEAVDIRGSVAVRAGGHRRRRPRDADRGAADGPRDPAVSRQLAQHADRLHLDSAVDPVVDLDPQPAGPDHQRDDARRAGARRGHPGGRCDGGDREHASQHGDGEAAGARGSGRRSADCRADVRLYPLHLHRVRAGAAADGNGAVPVHAAGDGGGVRDDGVVPAVANAGADDGALPAAKRNRGVPGRRSRRNRAALEPSSRRERAVRAVSLSLHGPAERVARQSGAGADRVHGRVARIAPAGPAGRPRFLSRRRRRDDAAACPDAAGNAHRGDRAPVRGRRAGDSRHAAGRRARDHPRQHRDPERVEQPRAGRCAEHRGHRRRDSHFPQSRAPRARPRRTKSSCASG